MKGRRRFRVVAPKIRTQHVLRVMLGVARRSFMARCCAVLQLQFVCKHWRALSSQKNNNNDSSALSFIPTPHSPPPSRLWSVCGGPSFCSASKRKIACLRVRGKITREVLRQQQNGRRCRRHRCDTIRHAMRTHKHTNSLFCDTTQHTHTSHTANKPLVRLWPGLATASQAEAECNTAHASRSK